MSDDDGKVISDIVFPAAMGFGIQLVIIWVLGFFASLITTCAQTGVPQCPGFSTQLDWARIFLVTAPLFVVALIGELSLEAKEDGDAFIKILCLFIFTTFLYPASLINHWIAYALVLVPFAFFYGLNFIRGCHYLFVRHPTEPIVTPALRSGDAIDHKALAKTLRKEADDEGFRPVFHYKNLAEKARQMREKLDADAEIAEATIRRERARAALLDAEREVEEAKRRTRDKQ